MFDISTQVMAVERCSTTPQPPPFKANVQKKHGKKSTKK